VRGQRSGRQIELFGMTFNSRDIVADGCCLRILRGRRFLFD
jgi:hypothetical protein